MTLDSFCELIEKSMKQVVTNDIEWLTFDQHGVNTPCLALRCDFATCPANGGKTLWVDYLEGCLHPRDHSFHIPRARGGFRRCNFFLGLGIDAVHCVRQNNPVFLTCAQSCSFQFRSLGRYFNNSVSRLFPVQLRQKIVHRGNLYFNSRA